ncbi:recombinase family protein [Streptomyces sp. NPDC056549]|uniref:recombinase family protein n=1 Tax=Streptomyces sp. NPDC056549 TaxID=3345864 RepID=UPI00368B5288
MRQKQSHGVKLWDGCRNGLAYARVSTTAQDLARQLDSLRAAGVAEQHNYRDKRTGTNMDRDGLTALLGFARPGRPDQPADVGPAGMEQARDSQLDPALKGRVWR